MSACRVGAIEAYVFGELDRAREAEVRAHVEACPRCARDFSALRAERALFTARARVEADRGAPPNFADVLRRSRGERRRPWLRRALPASLCLAAAAAITLFFATGGGNSNAPALSRTTAPREDLPPEFSCYEGEPVTAENAAYVLDRAIVRLEDEYRACLLATPTEEPSRAAKPR